MKKFLFITLIAFGINAKAQINYETSYPMSNYSDYLHFVRLESSGDKYCKWSIANNAANNKLTLYNLNHSVFRQISIPLQVDTFNYQIWYLAEMLFDNDSTDIDYLITNGMFSSAFAPYVKIYNENSSLLFFEDSASVNWGTGSPGGFDYRGPIFNTDSGTKMILTKYNNLAPITPSQSKVYNLPSKLNCGCSIGNGNIATGNPSIISNPNRFLSNPYPNPAINSTRIDYTFPSGVNEGEIVFYTLQGKEIKRFKVDKTFDHLLISTADIPAGTYFYQLQTNSQASEGKKLVVIR
ncbi:MAG: T9SS type A sorting domain-containing protein [Bacteroidetes bacterium]|nr:T9SS type A sorting domain-containing protein [Bacteroidota bacterium]